LHLCFLGQNGTFYAAFWGHFKPAFWGHFTPMLTTMVPGHPRLNFGNWLILDFPRDRVSITLLKDQVDPDIVHHCWDGFASAKQMAVHSILRTHLNPFSSELQLIYQRSCEFMRQHFRNWKGTPYRGAHRPELFEALFDEAQRDELLSKGWPLSDSAPTTKITRYWRITLPEEMVFDAEDEEPLKQSIWQPCLANGLAAIGFNNDSGNPQVQLFSEIRPGDQVLAYLRNKRIGGIGTVVSGSDEELPPEDRRNQDFWQGRYWFRIGVDWQPVEISVEDLPEATQRKFWMKTVVELSEAEFEAVKKRSAQAKYDEQLFQRNTSLLPKTLADILSMIEDKKHLVFHGPPGTGKTYMALELAKLLTGLAEPPASRVEIVQFHPAYGYEDFIEGIRPVTSSTEEGRQLINYPTHAGLFRRFCENAARNDKQKHVSIIDEINHGNIPRIFGELMLLLEYRSRDVRLPYSGERFRIPENVYLIGTMNTADRSIALVDFALRRRFHFFEFKADPDLFDRWLSNQAGTVPYLGKLYRRLTQEAINEPAFRIGPSYFMGKDLTEEQIRRIWEHSIMPYLAEYYIEKSRDLAKWNWNSSYMQQIRQPEL
jgi:MoxR-like ATPase